MLSFVCALLIANPGANGIRDQPEPGGYLLQLYSRSVIGSGGFLADGSYLPLDALFVDTQINLYAEYSVREELTVVGGVLALGWAQLGPNQTAYGGPMLLGARLRLPELATLLPELDVALEVRVVVNPGFGSDWIGAGPLEDSYWLYRPNQRQQAFDAELRVRYDLPWGLWLAAHASARHRSGLGPQGQIFMGEAQLGARFELGLAIAAFFYWHQPNTTLRANNLTGAAGTRFLAAGGMLAYHWRNFGFFVGVDGTFAAQANVSGPFVTVGIEHRS